MRMLVAILLGLCLAPAAAIAAEPLRVATFNVDATPAVGTPVAYAPVRKVLDPLYARGVVLLTGEKPIVLCAVDWIGIGNGGHDVWREELAEAAGTTADRVAVHALHQHDGPRCDFTTEAILADRGLGGRFYDNAFCRRVIARAADAVKDAIQNARPVTHVGLGQAQVEKVASNRRILGPDGKVKIIRWSKMTDPAAIAAPEGVIDPYLKLISFWSGDEPVAVLSYYATHPQSYYGDGDVTSEFVGLARAARDAALPGVLHVHFNGAGGNVTAGKYNDGSEAMRPVLASRMEDGMRRAWESIEKSPVTAADVDWRVREVQLPPGEHLQRETILAALDDENAGPQARLGAASDLAFLQRHEAGAKTDLSLLRIGDALVLHMPGELFVEYQLAAQKMRPDAFVGMAAYGDYGPNYIGDAIAYTQGGYETSNRASNVAPAVEAILMNAMRELLDVEEE
ncbi:MAG: hypothetical protein KY475_04650 [Planctomycetes bacterium]|nr:hypothetical protein [Planctomycetota bacterium]